MSARLKPTPPVKRHPAQAGDLIQYAFDVPGWFGRETQLTTRRVITVLDFGAAFVVEGGFQVRAAQITAHISTREVESESDDDYEWCGAGGS